MPEISRLTFLAQQAGADSERWYGDLPATQTLSHYLHGLGGETGELQNLYKKIECEKLDPKDPATIMKLRSETTDVFVYWLNVVNLLQFDADAMNQYIRVENEKRFMPARRARDARRN